jgi:methionyl-tRNA formyltransferase
MARPRLDYRKICKEQQIQIAEYQKELKLSESTMEYAQKLIKDLLQKSKQWEQQAMKYDGVIDYLEKQIQVMNQKLTELESK